MTIPTATTLWPQRERRRSQPLSTPILLLALAAALFVSPGVASAATTAEQAGAGLHGTLAVRGPLREHGDWAAHVGGVYSPHRLFIEVPPGTANLVIEVFDAENGTTHEFSGTTDPTEVHHRLFQPSGAEVGGYSTRLSSLTRTGSTATAVVPGHGLATGNTVKILGAIQPEYNVTASVTVVDANTFTYTVAGSPASPATGFVELLPRRATVTNLTRTGTTATATTSAAHGLLVGQEVVVFGATPTGYNGRSVVLTTPTATTFTYTVVNTLTTPATGSIALAPPRATSLTALSRTGGTATATTAAAHGLAAGQAVRILNASVAAYNSTFDIVSVPTPTTFTFALAGGPDSATAAVVQFAMPLFIAGTPAGAATTGDNGTLNVPNDGWRTVYRVANPAAGHWEYRVDARTEIQADAGGDDNVNGYGIRVHDGDNTSGGTELNMYYDGMAIHTATAGQNKVFSYYPYVTAAGATTSPATNCGLIENAFDEDDGTNDLRIYPRTESFPARPAPTYGPGVLPAPVGPLTVSGTALTARSANNSWHANHRVLTGFDTDILHDGLGIWLHRWAQNGQNLQTFYYGNSDALPIETTSYDTIQANPGLGKFRVYLPTDGFAAPVKPYVVLYLGGADVPADYSVPNWVSVHARVVNPTPFPITFDSGRQVLIPWAADSISATIANSHSPYASQGSRSYNAGLKRWEWNPGTVAANSSAEIEVVGLVTPLLGAPFPVTNGVTATWLDETANTSQSRATYTFGPMCNMFLQVGMTLDADVAEFKAAAAGVGAPVIIDWTTVAELDNAGFHLYRAVSNADGSTSRGERLTPSLVAAQGSEAAGASYQFLDTTPIASRDEQRGYYLVDVDLAGTETEHGPMYATIGAGASRVDGWEKF